MFLFFRVIIEFDCNRVQISSTEPLQMYHLPSQTRPGDIFLLIRYNYSRLLQFLYQLRLWLYETLKRDNNSKGEPWIIHKQTKKNKTSSVKTSWLYRLPFPNELNINFLDKDGYSYFSEALTHNTTPREGGRNGLTVSLPDEAKKIKEGRTINLKTSQGRKRVFIPKGWMFCTVSPFKCYSTNSRKKSKETFSLAALGNFILFSCTLV